MDQVFARMKADVKRVQINVNADALERRNKTFAAARFFLARGFRPIPIIPHEKRPFVGWLAFTQRPPTLAEITQWWNAHPDAWLALVTGAGPGHVALDVDPRHGGSLDGLDIPSGAAIVRTPSGGTHIHLAHPGGYVTSRILRPGVEIKGDRSTVIVPPSPGYMWTTPIMRRFVGDNGRDGFPVAPEWIRAPLESKKTLDHEPTANWFATTLGPETPAGTRNENAKELVRYLIKRRIPPDG